MSRLPALAGLERQHAALEREIEAAVTHHEVDTLKITEMKRRKLHLKDEIERLRIRQQTSLH